MSQKDIFIRSVKDFFTLEMLKYSLAPFIITIILMYSLFFYIAGAGVDQLGQMQVHSTQTSIQNGVPHTETIDSILEGSAIIEFLMSYAITSWIATFLIYALGSFLVLYVSIFIAIIVIGFLTPAVLKVLQKRHYNDVKMIGFSNIFSSVFLVFKWAFLMFLMFLALIPFYFIPLVNLVAFNLPLYYFFHKMLTFDIASNICTKEESKKLMYFNGNSIRIKTALLYLTSLIPFAIFFTAIFYVVYLGNSYFLDMREMRNKEVAT